MSFNLEKLFEDVFAPGDDELVTILYDRPHGDVVDNEAWRERRIMAEDWHRTIVGFSDRFGMQVNSPVTFEPFGSHNADLPEMAECQGEPEKLEAILERSTIVLALTEFSASAPLFGLTGKFPRLRAASMPRVMRSMESTGLTADYRKIAETCARMAPPFTRAVGVEVEFSTGHSCYFDISADCRVGEDNGLLPPDLGPDKIRIANLPAGEVYICPNEAVDSKTAGEIPVVMDDESMLFVVARNQIVEVVGDGPVALRQRESFKAEPALRNIAEVAIGCNDKAVVTGNVLEDEKAGFHWAYGRSDHLGGKVGVSDFSSPDKVNHQDIVYAKGSPIVCRRFDFVFADGDRQTAIVDGDLQV